MNGKSDILWRNDNGMVAIWEMNGLSFLSEKSYGFVGWTPGKDWQVKATGTEAQQQAALELVVETRRKLYGILAAGRPFVAAVESTCKVADVARDFGPDFNPFDAHRRAVISLELLVERPHLTAQAVAAGIDVLVVDEAHRLRRPKGHPGEPAWRAVAPIADLGRHVLLLSATPLEDDAHGFFRLLQLLRPDEFPEDASFDARLAGGVPVIVPPAQRDDYSPVDGPLDGRGRRSLYLEVRRNHPSPFLFAFDQPKPAAPAGRRVAPVGNADGRTARSRAAAILARIAAPSREPRDALSRGWEGCRCRSGGPPASWWR